MFDPADHQGCRVSPCGECAQAKADYDAEMDYREETARERARAERAEQERDQFRAACETAARGIAKRDEQIDRMRRGKFEHMHGCDVCAYCASGDIALRELPKAEQERDAAYQDRTREVALHGETVALLDTAREERDAARARVAALEAAAEQVMHEMAEHLSAASARVAELEAALIAAAPRGPQRRGSMARSERTVEAFTCDVCGADAYEWDSCWGCGKNLCDKHEVEMAHAVYFSGSSDAHYCQPCYDARKASGADPEFNAYLAVQTLRAEYKAFCDSFEPRQKSAQAECERLAGVRRDRRRS